MDIAPVEIPRVAGIDVGGPNKGYHAIAWDGATEVVKFHTREPVEMAEWCRDQRAAVVAVDAPCRWRVHGHPARAAERELAADRISCFSTPTEEKARGHAFYTWMFAGQELYAALAAEYPVFTGGEPPTRVAIETFPQAVACALRAGIVSAKPREKRAVRLAVLQEAGWETSRLATMDDIDAALCAVAAQYFRLGRAKLYGDAVGGFIVVPAVASDAASAARPMRRAASTPAFDTINRLLPKLSAAEREALRARLQEPHGRPMH